MGITGVGSVFTSHGIRDHKSRDCDQQYSFFVVRLENETHKLIGQKCKQGFAYNLCTLYYSLREVLLNVSNENYVTDVYNVVGVIKGSTHPGRS